MAVVSGGHSLSHRHSDYGSYYYADGDLELDAEVVCEAVCLERQAGPVLFTRTSKKLLSQLLNEVYILLQPKQADWDNRQNVIEFIAKLVKRKIPGSSISAFGSFVMDLFTSISDFDLSLDFADGRCDSRKDQIRYLKKVEQALYGLQNGQQRSVRKIEAVYSALVPVVRCVHTETGIKCDITVENDDGYVKSHVLGMVASMDSRFRELCYLVKAWAKKHKVNSSRNGTLNSLSICLLVAFHLQTRHPPIFPPFSVFVEGLHYLQNRGNYLQTVERRVREYKTGGFGKDNIESVPELFCSFFTKLATVESLWEQGLCCSTYEGKWISKIWPNDVIIANISVEDFTDRTQNAARSVTEKEFKHISRAVCSTVSCLGDPVRDILEAEGLKDYLFGSIKQRYKTFG